MLVVKNKRSPYTCNDERWNNQYAFHPLLMNELQRFLGTDAHTEIPKVNITEDDKSYTIELAAPGVTKEDLKINIEKDLLTISSEVNPSTKAQGDNKKEDSSTNTKSEEKKPKFLKKEFSYYGFKRSFKIPENAETGGINASYVNGILSVVIPKRDTPKEAGSKTISIS